MEVRSETEMGFREGDELWLARGTYQGTPGVFLRFRPDARWAEIVEQGGRVRIHPVEWMTKGRCPLAAVVEPVLCEG